jgi:two-component system response regulator HydG
LLDEIGELEAMAHAKLLRVLQEGELRPVGEDHPVRVDVRILAATHRQARQRG